MKEMKAVLLSALVMLIFSGTVNAQWTKRSCEVTDLTTLSAEEFNCLWSKASRTAQVGKITTIVGSSIIVLGGLQIALFRTEESVWTAVFFAMIGGAVDLVGAPLWITGASRKNKLKQSPHFQNLNLASVQISPILASLPFEHSPYVGMRISLKF